MPEPYQGKILSYQRIYCVQCYCLDEKNTNFVSRAVEWFMSLGWTQTDKKEWLCPACSERGRNHICRP